MALSDLLTTLAQRAKEAEDRARSATNEAKADLQAQVDRAAQDARATADELTKRADAAAEEASGWWTQVQSDWSKHVATVRENVAAKKKAIDMSLSPCATRMGLSCSALRGNLLPSSMPA